MTYTIYTSASGQSPGQDTKVLAANTLTDAFVSKLEEQTIVARDKPTKATPTVAFDATDPTALWFANSLDPSGTLSVTFDDNVDLIISFSYTLTAPYRMVFTSSSSALLDCFGAPTNAPPGTQARIPEPGLQNQGDLLCLALDSAQTSTQETTVKALFGFVHLDASLNSLPKQIAALGVKLDAKSSHKHNAIWFDPTYANQTVLRLQWDIPAFDDLTNLLKEALPTLAITDASVISRQVLTKATSVDNSKVETIAVPDGQIDFYAECSVTTPGSTVGMQAAITFSGSDIDLILTFKDSDSLPSLLNWLGETVSNNPNAFNEVNDLLKKGAFSAWSVRQTRLGVVPDDQGKPKLDSFAVDVEVKANFGEASDGRSVFFLLTYLWQSGGPTSGVLSGQLWNSFDLDVSRDLFPLYETWTDLHPSQTSPEPARTINIPALVTGGIDSFPENLPQDISSAQASISSEGLSISAILSMKRVTPGKVPQPYISEICLDFAYGWTNKGAFQLGFSFAAGLLPPVASVHRMPATLRGSIDYVGINDKRVWKLKAELAGLYASCLYSFFGAGSEDADHVLPLIDGIEMESLTVEYDYESSASPAPAPGQTQTAGTSFLKIHGKLLIAGLELELDFNNDGGDAGKGWHFEAHLDSADDHATIGQILHDLLGEDDLELPEFLENTLLNGSGPHEHPFRLVIDRYAESPGDTSTPGAAAPSSSSSAFRMVAEIAIGGAALTFAQYHSGTWAADIPPKRLIKFGIDTFPQAFRGFKIPLIGEVSQPFDEIYYMWVQDKTNKNKGGHAGLTRSEITDINKALTKPLIPRDKVQQMSPSDVLIAGGSHFTVVIKDASGNLTCILDYDFAKQTSVKKQPGRTVADPNTGSGEPEDKTVGEGKGEVASAPLKKKSGPLSIKNFGLKFADKKLHIVFDATMELGPVGLELIGFSIDLDIKNLHQIPGIDFSLSGLAVAFEKPPITIGGIIIRGKTEQIKYYAGGLVVGVVPWQLQAAGFYGEALKPGATKPDDTFTSMFVFARLEGPLITLEFAEISGVTAGFGYQSSMRTPTPEQIVDFPFVATSSLDSGGGGVIQTLEKLVKPDTGAWFQPLVDTYWAAAGLKVDAFQMLAVNAVVVAQFGASTKLGIFAAATADLPTAKSTYKFAHVELGISSVVDFDYGLFATNAQLSPRSYILDPSCHLTGGFALYYWFDAPHANRDLVGSFVFTLGGYHQAFQVPDGYPNPPRLGISWSLGDNLSITGEAYFAITPKVCMGGGRLHAMFSAGPIKAWFDAYADFLINYKPFRFNAQAGIAVGVSFNIDKWFIHIHISVEISADLYLWGPPLAGRVHVDLWVHAFNIDFGDNKYAQETVDLLAFYQLVLQSGSNLQGDASTDVVDPRAPRPKGEIVRPQNEGHNIQALSGLMNASNNANREPNATWYVRGGSFSVMVSCKMAIASASQATASVSHNRDQIYAKPMGLTSPMDSSMAVKISQDGSSDDDTWRLEKVVKNVPSGLWGYYDSSKDPAALPPSAGNQVKDLLNDKEPGAFLLMGLIIKAPLPQMSPDKLPVFDMVDASFENIYPHPTFIDRFKDADASFSAAASLPLEEPSTQKTLPDQWNLVHKTWTSPGLGAAGQSGFVQKWAELFDWDTSLATTAAIPARADRDFMNMYVGAPLVSAG